MAIHNKNTVATTKRNQNTTPVLVVCTWIKI